ncbi:MAG: diacylglycerol/polyprenol kinase family protein [Candidatus Bathyarchaeales archaeon]
MVDEVLWNILLMIVCYIYIGLIIVVSSKLDGFLHVSRKVPRKFLHVMIGNLPFVIPFFTSNIYPTLVAAPFILVTFLASPYSPLKFASEKMKGLVGITEEGHHLGLVYYAFSYTVLALFFASKPYVMSAGILPMAYGDAFASIIGEKYGKTKFRLLANKSIEGSITMFLFSFSSYALSLAFFSTLYPISFLDKILGAFIVAIIATVVEGISPLGFDNLTVPLLSVLTLVLLGWDV